MKKLYASGVMAFAYAMLSSAQVGINTQTPQTTLDVDGSIQLRNELQVDGNPGTAGQIYFSQGDNPADLNDWKNVNVPFLEEGQYQLVNTYAVKDEVGIDFTGASTTQTVVFNETFDENSSTRASWVRNDYTSGSVEWIWKNGSGNGIGPGSDHTNSGGSSNRSNASFSYNSYDYSTRLVSPVLNLSGIQNPKLSFWYAQERWSNQYPNDINELKVYYRTSSSSSWQQLAHYTGRVSGWTEIPSLDLPNPTSTYQIAFEGINNYGGANVVDDVRIYYTPTNQNSYNPALSTLGETITSKNWTKIPGLDLDIKINDSHNKISMIYQTGVESRTNTGNNTSAQTEGNVRYMCGVFRKLKSAADNTAVLVAVRGDQINNAVGKSNQLKSQSIYTLTYTVQDVPAEEYTFSVACRRLSLNLTGTGSEASSLLSIGNAVNGSGTGKTNNFMLNSVLKVDVIELVTITGL